MEGSPHQVKKRELPRHPASAWSYAAALQSGAPSYFSILPSAPFQGNPYWYTTPTFASSALLTTDVTGCAPRAGLGDLLYGLNCQQLWFALSTPYTTLRNGRHRKRELVQDALALSGLRGSSAEPKYTVDEVNHAKQLASRMAADQNSFFLRIFAYVLSWLYRWAFGGEVYVDQQGLSKLQQMRSLHQFVYVPTHRSHVDYLMMSYILFAAGLECPHIAAGDNLAIPLVGAFLRKGGAFFIRRSTKATKDSELYKKILAGYVHAVLQNEHSLEFFIEGGRSRDGSVQKPKLGLLAMVVNAVLDGQLDKSVALVPTTIIYDKPLEEDAMLRELAGQAKAKESLGGVLRFAASIVWRLALASCGGGHGQRAWGGPAGVVTVTFGEPISIKRFLKDRSRSKRRRRSSSSKMDRPDKMALEAVSSSERPSEYGEEDNAPASPSILTDTFPLGSSARRNAVEALGGELMERLRGAVVLPASTILLGAIMAAGGLPRPGTSGSEGLYTHGPWLSRDDVLEAVDWLEQECRYRKTRFVSITLSSCPEFALLRAARLMISAVEMEEGAAGQLRMRLIGSPVSMLCLHVRINQLLPTFAAEGLVAATLHSITTEAADWQAPNGGLPDAAPPVPPQYNVTRCGLLSSGWCSRSSVVSGTLSLRHLLSSCLDLALGAEGLTSCDSVQRVVMYMGQQGLLAERVADDNGRSPEVYIKLARSSSKHNVAEFARQLLTPFLATYSCMADVMVQIAKQQRSNVLSSSVLLRTIVDALALQEGSLPLTSWLTGQLCGPAVPSLLIMQGGLSVLRKLQLLLSEDEEERHPLTTSSFSVGYQSNSNLLLLTNQQGAPGTPAGSSPPTPHTPTPFQPSPVPNGQPPDAPATPEEPVLPRRESSGIGGISGPAEESLFVAEGAEAAVRSIVPRLMAFVRQQSSGAKTHNASFGTNPDLGG